LQAVKQASTRASKYAIEQQSSMRANKEAREVKQQSRKRAST